MMGSSTSYPSVSPDEAWQEMQQGTPYIDVRTTGEWVAGHPKGAVHIDISEPDFVGRVEQQFPDKEQRVLVACQAGGRSKRAMAQLLESGYSNAVEMPGGFSAWTGPVETGN